MEDFNQRKRAYLQKLRNNPLLVEGIMNKKDTNSPEVMLAVFDPKTEGELTIAEGLVTILGDSLAMIVDYGEVEIEDYNQEDIYSIFKRVILALKNNNQEELAVIKEELTKLASPEELGKLSYGVIKVFTLNAFAVLDILAEDCGFDLTDEVSAMQFKIYFEQANAKINELMPTILLNNKSIDLNDKETIDFIKRYATSFHESYKRDFENEKKHGF